LECFQKKKMDLPLKNQYKKFVKTLCEYEIVIGEKLQLRNIRIANIKSFAEYPDWKLSSSYSWATSRPVPVFPNRAVEQHWSGPVFQARIYFDKDDDVEGVYLNERNSENCRSGFFR
jgi:hypothetical protein